jgi:hypothetical protein
MCHLKQVGFPFPWGSFHGVMCVEVKTQTLDTKEDEDGKGEEV